jgi:hypothetical protein
VTNRDVAFLSFKLVGLWLMAETAIGVSSMIPFYWGRGFEDVPFATIAPTLAPMLVSIGIGVPVWFSAGWFAARVFPAESSERLQLGRLRNEPLFALALSVIGVFFVCESIPIVVHGISLFWQSRMGDSRVLGPDPDYQRLIWSATARANTVAGIARLLVGLALLTGPARITAALVRVRKELGSSLETGDPSNGNEKPRE